MEVSSSFTMNLLSGFAGAILGALAVWYVSHQEQINAARNYLINLLLCNGYAIWWPSDGDEAWEVIESNYVEIQAAYLALRRLTFFRKDRLDNAWINYTGISYYRELQKNDPAKIFAKSAVTKDEAIKRIIVFLQALKIN